MTNIVKLLVGSLGFVIFAFGLLTALAQPVAAADTPECWWHEGEMFARCADLDTSTIIDLR